MAVVAEWTILLGCVATIAKLAIESSQAKYDSIKENQDKVFSLIVAFAAPLTFFGFKGFDTFQKIHAEAADAADKAREVSQFLDKQYGKDNKADFLITNAAALRDLARLREHIPAVPIAVREEYLKAAKSKLEKEIELDIGNFEVMERALGTLGNVFYRLGGFKEAKKCSERIINKASDELAVGDKTTAHKYDCEAMMKLAIFLENETNKMQAKADIKSEADFRYLENQMSSEFSAILAKNDA